MEKDLIPAVIKGILVALLVGAFSYKWLLPQTDF